MCMGGIITEFVRKTRKGDSLSLDIFKCIYKKPD
jgi:hypothetical protein